MHRAIEILFFGQKMNFLWIFEVCCPVGPKESIHYPKSVEKSLHDGHPTTYLLKKNCYGLV